MKLIIFTRPNGQPVAVNPEWVMLVQKADDSDASKLTLGVESEGQDTFIKVREPFDEVFQKLTA